MRHPRSTTGHRGRPVRVLSRLICVLAVASTASGQTQSAGPQTGAELYEAACASCHGTNGQGAPQEAIAFSTPVPDFTDCEFAPREPDITWLAVIHEGGPARGFDRMMPAFGDALTPDQARLILGHVRTQCLDRAWPHGDLNFPKALITEKAFPEDEVVVTTTAAAEGPGNVSTKAVYERRIGARTQMELVVPIATQYQSSSEVSQWVGGLGDVAVALKRVLLHNRARGHIVSASAELVTPTGNQTKGLGSGHATLEPFVTWGQLLPADWFLQTQSGLGLPLQRDVTREAFWRVVMGRSFMTGRWGRVWSPMVEVLGSRELSGGEKAMWDVLPEMQVTLSTRQHVRLNLGVRVPLNEASSRPTRVMTYVLWDWYEGGFFDGW